MNIDDYFRKRKFYRENIFKIYLTKKKMDYFDEFHLTFHRHFLF